MRFTEDDTTGRYRIQAYATGQVTVNHETLTCSMIVAPDRLIRDWPPRAFEDLTAAYLALALALEPEILLIGTGERLRFPHPRLTGEIQRRGIGVEVMDTPAACRTYNVLLDEQRRVAAALLMI